ncbi:major capsid protein [Pantoea phage vB_PagS_AAS23]|uniref:Major capsid protein n=1 Tax=Pantoea phage vB_PagS_AAS23 TaxID=2499073 RepID=A0A3S9U7S1_9CAUD|nr:major head protein [Pantoea phage vB_PagS_AAS23]AZS06320.1 major capsid protein [Pantoea phage vB_PagS_AAS23]
MTMKLDSFEQNEITIGLRKMGIGAEKADAVGLWTVEQMKQVLTRQYEASYPQTSALALFPVTTELSRTTNTFEYRSFDGVTSAKIIADYTDDLPTVEAMSTPETGRVHRLGNAWLISGDEIEVGAALGSSLSDRKASLAREGHETLVNRLVFKGSAPHKIISVFNHPNVTRITSAGWGTDPEVANDELEDLIEQIETITNGQNRVTDIVVPPSKRRLLAKRMPETTESYLSYFQKQNSGITFSSIAELEDIDGAGTKAVLAYEKNPLNMSIEIPEPFHMLPMQPKDLHFKVPCTSKATGLIVYRPLTIAMLVGV